MPVAGDAEALVLGEMEPQHVHPVPGQGADQLQNPVLGVILPSGVQMEAPLAGLGIVHDPAIGQAAVLQGLQNGPQAVERRPLGLGRQRRHRPGLNDEALLIGFHSLQRLRLPHADDQVAGQGVHIPQLGRRAQPGVLLSQQVHAGRYVLPGNAAVHQDHAAAAAQMPPALSLVFKPLGMGKCKIYHIYTSAIISLSICGGRGTDPRRQLFQIPCILTDESRSAPACPPGPFSHSPPAAAGGRPSEPSVRPEAPRRRSR